MRKLSILLIFISISLNVLAQWHIYGQEHLWASPYQLIETADHGFIVIYEFQDYEGSARNSAVLKVDINGNLLWEKLMGNNEKFLQLNGIAESADGGFVLSGWTCLIDEYADPFILKVNPCFETEWCKIYSTHNIDDFAGEIVYLPEEKSYITYFFYNQNPTHQKVSLIKLDSAGNTIWQNNFINNPEYIGELPLTLDYSEQDSSVILGGFVYAYEDSTSMYALQPYWSKINTDGIMKWEIYHIPDSSFTYGLSSRNPVLLDNNDIILPLVQSPSIGKLFEVNSVGTFKWLKTLHQPDSIVAVAINSTEILNNNLYIGAQYFITGYDGIGYGSVVKNDTSGNFISQCIVPGDFTSIVYSICASHDDKLLITSSHEFEGTDFLLIKYNQNLEYDTIYNIVLPYDTLCLHSITPEAIEMNCDVVTDVSYIEPNGSTVIKFAPNPADEFTIITLPDLLKSGEQKGLFNMSSYKADYVKELKLDVYDNNGRKVFESPWPDNAKEKALYTSDWKTGIYLIKISNEKQLLLSGKLMIK